MNEGKDGLNGAKQMVRYRVGQEKVSTFENPWHQEYFIDLNDPSSS